uniref:Putative secreted protein n=1 Tax=Panstrongylus lignarius TaxID=156445 RepID=A0A224Y2D8_9HEMI
MFFFHLMEVVLLIKFNLRSVSMFKVENVIYKNILLQFFPLSKVLLNNLLETCLNRFRIKKYIRKYNSQYLMATSFAIKIQLPRFSYSARHKFAIHNYHKYYV